MAKKPERYIIPAGYGYSSPMDLRRQFSDLISQAIDQKQFGGLTRRFSAVYQHATQLTSGCCFYCNQKLTETERDGPLLALMQGAYAWDHFRPASRYGLFIIGNVVLACAKCNLEKSDAPAFEYWASRKARKMPLRFKTEAEFYKVQSELTSLESENNIAGFYPIVVSEDEFSETEPQDILEACRIVGGSSIAAEFLESYTPGGVARWLRLARQDADIFEQLADVTDSSGIYESYTKRTGREIGSDARIDVKARITRFCESIEDLTGKDDIRDLTPIEFRTLVKSVMLSVKDKINETNKFKRLIRVLVGHPDLEGFRVIVEDQAVL